MKEYWNRTAERSKAIEQAKISVIHQINSLRTVSTSFTSSVNKYNTDIVGLLGQKDQDDIRDIVGDTTEVIERCEGTVPKLRTLILKKVHSKSELAVLREELNGAIATIQCLQASFNTLVSHPLDLSNT